MAWPPEPDNRFTSGGEPPDAECDAADALARFASDARVEQRVAERRRERWHRRLIAEETSFASLLVSLAEIGAPVAVLNTTGTTHSGIVIAVGTDVVALRPRPGEVTLLALDRVVTLDAGRSEPLGTDRRDGERAGGPTLRHLLAELADEQPEATFTFDGGATIRGSLAWVGRDVVAVNGASGERPPARGGLRYVRLSSVAAVSVRVSG